MNLGDHLCLPYGSDDEKLAVLGRFLVDGLSRGEKVVYVSDDTVPESLSAWLGALNIDARPAWERGQLELRSAETVYAPLGHFDVDASIKALGADVNAARQSGYKGLRIVSEMSWALKGLPGSDQLADFERRIQPIYDARGVTGICKYDRRLFGPDLVDRHAECHWLVVEPDPLHDEIDLTIVRSFQPRGLRIIGTVDRNTSPGLAAVLERWLVTEPGDIHVDMANLHFIDVAGLRLLVEVARGLRGRELRLANLAPMLRRVVSIVGWDDTPGLVLTEDEVVPA